MGQEFPTIKAKERREGGGVAMAAERSRVVGRGGVCKLKKTIE